MLVAAVWKASSFTSLLLVLLLFLYEIYCFPTVTLLTHRPQCCTLGTIPIVQEDLMVPPAKSVCLFQVLYLTNTKLAEYC